MSREEDRNGNRKEIGKKIGAISGLSSGQKPEEFKSDLKRFDPYFYGGKTKKRRRRKMTKTRKITKRKRKTTKRRKSRRRV
uniref:Uncharacterized protein n=1 Tax=viral metagenome TaxID=1070528 RepID=A0A6C0LEY7_9ZZZZ